MRLRCCSCSSAPRSSSPMRWGLPRSRPPCRWRSLSRSSQRASAGRCGRHGPQARRPPDPEPSPQRRLGPQGVKHAAFFTPRDASLRWHDAEGHTTCALTQAARISRRPFLIGAPCFFPTVSNAFASGRGTAECGRPIS